MTIAHMTGSGELNSQWVFQTATVRNVLTRQQSSKYYYQVCESINSISCLKFHIEKKCWGIINLDNHYIINPLSLHAILNFSFFLFLFRTLQVPKFTNLVDFLLTGNTVHQQLILLQLQPSQKLWCHVRSCYCNSN